MPVNKKTLFLAAAVILASACSGNSGKYIVLSGYAQGGTYSVKINTEGVNLPADRIHADIDSLLQAIDFSLSGYNHNSILSRRNAGENVPTDRFFDEVLAQSEHYREITGGAFDTAAGPLFDIWGFGFKSGQMPNDSLVRAALQECKSRKVLNFNAIAQGYTSDVIAEYLHGIGVHDMLVDIGEIYCEGLNPKGQGWTVGIDTPTDGNNSPGKSISGVWTSDGGAHGIVTSGNYRKFYIRDGKKYAHTIDPRTGYPVDHDLLSATVVAPTATEADALATFFMVIGYTEARAWVEDHDGIEACLITTDQTWRSEGF